MTLRGRCLLLTVIVLMAFVALPAFACERAGSSTHVGEITAIDPAQQSLTIMDRQMNMPVTFLAAPEELKGLSLGQLIAVKYSERKGQLTAEEIQPR